MLYVFPNLDVHRKLYPVSLLIVFVLKPYLPLQIISLEYLFRLYGHEISACMVEINIHFVFELFNAKLELDE